MNPRCFEFRLENIVAFYIDIDEYTRRVWREG